MATSAKSVNMSIPKAIKVRGYTIDRMPIGRFLRATQALQDAPEDIMRQLFPDTDGQDVLKQLAGLNKDGLQALFLRALTVLPEYAVRVFAVAANLDEMALLNDPDVGLDGLTEMLDAWLAVNNIANFTVAAGALWEKVRNWATKPGFNG